MADILNTFTAGQLFYANWRRMGDHMRHALGDVEVECPECHGECRVDYDSDIRPGTVERRTCQTCDGLGSIWREKDE